MKNLSEFNISVIIGNYNRAGKLITFVVYFFIIFLWIESVLHHQILLQFDTMKKILF